MTCAVLIGLDSTLWGTSRLRGDDEESAGMTTEDAGMTCAVLIALDPFLRGSVNGGGARLTTVIFIFNPQYLAPALFYAIPASYLQR